MTLNILASLLILALFAGWRRYKRLARALVAIGLLWFFAVACGPVPRILLLLLQRPYVATPVGTWAPRNAIVLLGGGNTRLMTGAELAPSLFAQGRILRAATLYRACKASGQQCRVFVSGGDSQQLGEAEATVYGEALRGLGVAAADLQLETRSMNTWQNAQFTRPLLQAWAPQRVLLVTSGVHLARSLLYFHHFALEPTPVRGDQVQAPWSVWPLGWNIALCDLALHEYVGMARFHVYNALGWNAPPVRGPIIPAAAP